MNVSIEKVTSGFGDKALFDHGLGIRQGVFRIIAVHISVGITGEII